MAESRMLQMTILRTRLVASNFRRNSGLVKGSSSKFRNDQTSSEASKFCHYIYSMAIPHSQYTKRISSAATAWLFQTTLLRSCVFEMCLLNAASGGCNRCNLCNGCLGVFRCNGCNRCKPFSRTLSAPAM